MWPWNFCARCLDRTPIRRATVYFRASAFEARTLTERILLAQIVGAHGIRGDVTARVYADDPDNLKRYGQLTDKSGLNTYVVTSVRMGTKGAILHLKGVSDRNDAEALRGVELYVARAKLPDADEGAYYHADLIGLAAVSADGQRMGSIIAVQNFGAGDLLEISVPGERETLLIPFRDQFVPEVDIKGGTVVIVPPVMIGEPIPKSERMDHDGHDDEE